MIRRTAGERWTGRLLSAVVILLLLSPLAAVALSVLWSTVDWQSLAHPLRQAGLLWNTAIIAVGTAAIATLLGGIAGVCIGYLRIPGRRALTLLLCLPLFLPPYMYAVVWVDLAGQDGWLTRLVGFLPGAPALATYSRGAVVLVLATAYAAIPMLATLWRLRRYDRGLEEAARLLAGPWRTFRSITLPLLAPALLIGGAIAFLLSLLNYAVPSLLQVQVYTVEIYTSFNSLHDPAAAAALALPLVLPALAAAGILIAEAFRSSSAAAAMEEGKAARGWAAIGGGIYCLALVVVALLLPCAVLALRLGSISALWTAWSTAGGELVTSLCVAAGSATVCVLAAALLLLLPKREHLLLIASALLPFLASGPLVGVGLIEVWNRPGIMGAVYDSLPIVILACAIRFAVFAVLAVAVALRQHNGELEEAAALSGANGRYRLIRIRLPMLAPALFAAWIIVAVVSLNELDTVILVYPPGWTPLSVRLFSLMHYGPSEVVAALCLLNMVVVAGLLAAGAAIHGITRRLGDSRPIP